MTREYLIVSDDPTSNGKKKISMIKSFSFTTDDDEFDTKIASNQIKQRTTRQEKTMEIHSQIKQKKPSSSERNYLPSRFFKYLLILFVVYLFWLTRHFWIERVLSTNSRISRSTTTKTETSEEESTNSSSSSQIINREIAKIKPDETQKSSLRTRKTKMKFNQKSTTDKRETTENTSLSNARIRFTNYDDIISQLRDNLKSHISQRDFYETILKRTRLNKKQIDEFIFKNNRPNLTLETFTSLLDLFDLMMIIVPK